jgi:AraC family cel operon transcriptional repressor
MKQSVWITAPGGDKPGFRIHKIEGGGGWSYPGHSHRGFCELVCATRGVFRHVINGKTRLQKSGEIILIRENDQHSLSGSNFTYVNIMFQADWFTRIDNFMQYADTAEMLLRAPSTPSVLVPSGEVRPYRKTLEQLLLNSGSINGRRLFAVFLLKMVIYHLAPPAEQEFPADMPEWLKKTLAWLSGRRGSLPTLAETVKYSCHCHEYFSREMKRRMGMTPSGYLTALRIDRAAEMLVTTNCKLMEVCSVAGFENTSYFFRVFRRRKGMTPAKYRRTFGPRSIQRPASG